MTYYLTTHLFFQRSKDGPYSRSARGENLRRAVASLKRAAAPPAPPHARCANTPPVLLFVRADAGAPCCQHPEGQKRGPRGGAGTPARHAQGCSNRESRESRGAKKRRFVPNREALNKIPNRPNRYLMTPAVQWELKVVAQTSLLLQRWV